MPGLEQWLSRDQVVELEHGQVTGLDQLMRIDLQVLGVDQSLRVGQPCRHRHADAHRMTFEGKESHDVGPVVQHRDPHAILQGAYGDRELRRQEGAVEGGVGTLKDPPLVEVGGSEVTGTNDGDAHELLPGCGGFPYDIPCT